MTGLRVGGLYRHYFRGGLYKLLHLGFLESDTSEVVVYLSLVDGQVWVRPLSEFQGAVKLADGVYTARFQLARDEEGKQLALKFVGEEITLDETPPGAESIPDDLICGFCLSVLTPENFVRCPRCEKMVCHDCMGKRQVVGLLICQACAEEVRGEVAVAKLPGDV